MTGWAATILVLALGVQQPSGSLDADALTRVRELYALASYEDALAQLDAAGARVDPSRAAQYRALCLLGLNRVADAERTIDRLVVDHPSYAIAGAEVPPRLFALFQAARERLLPSTARARYLEARAAFDRGQFPQAARGFREVQTLLADPAFIADIDGLRDLKALSDGFLDLAEREIQQAATPAPAAGTASPVAAASTIATRDPAPAPDPVRIYSDADSDVQPPVDVQRRLPTWAPPPALAQSEFRGLLDVSIDETGAVTAATLIAPIHPFYDGTLVEAATRWRFRPALKDGTPVPYRKTFAIVLGRR